MKQLLKLGILESLKMALEAFQADKKFNPFVGYRYSDLSDLSANDTGDIAWDHVLYDLKQNPGDFQCSMNHPRSDEIYGIFLIKDHTYAEGRPQLLLLLEGREGAQVWPIPLDGRDGDTCMNGGGSAIMLSGPNTMCDRPDDYMILLGNGTTIKSLQANVTQAFQICTAQHKATAGQ